MKTFIKDNRWPLIIAGVAILVRIVYLLELSRIPDVMVPMVDEKWHWLWARNIIEESFWGTGAYFRAPLYPYFLAFLSWITGGSILASKILQVLITGGTAWFLYHLADKLFNKKTAIVAGLIYAFYGTAIFYEAMLLIPVLFLFFAVWGIYRIVAFRESTSWKTWLLTGVIFGLATLSRPNILIVIPFLMVWMYFGTDKSLTFAKRARLPIALLIGAIITILPVTVRNVAVTGDFIFISSQGGINLYLGNNPEADGLTMLMPEVDLNEAVTWSQFEKITRQVAEAEAMSTLSDGELSSFWTGKAIDFMVHNPGTFLGLLWKKGTYLLSGFENSDNINIYFHRKRSVIYSLLLWDGLIYFPFGLLLPLTLVGLYVTRKEHKKLMPLYIFLLAYIPSIILFLVTARHRLPLVPFMIIISAGGLMALPRLIPKLSMKNMAIILGMFFIPLIVFNRSYLEDIMGGEFQANFNEGIRLQKLNDYAGAERSFMLADREYSQSPTLINSLAYVQMMQGKLDQAEANFHRAIHYDSSMAQAYNNLGLLMRRKNDPDSALVLYKIAATRHNRDRDDSRVLAQYYLNGADAYAAKGVLDSAEFLHRIAIDTDPDFPKAYFNAAKLYATINDFNRADSVFREGMERGEPSATDLFNWGLSFLKRLQPTAAVDRMHRVIKKDSSFYQAYHVIAAAYYENHQPDDSVNKYLDLVLRYNPSYGPSIQLKQIVGGR